MPKSKRRRDDSSPVEGSSGGADASIGAIDAAYADIDGYGIARAEKRRQRDNGIFETGIQYGEISSSAFATALEWCSPKSGETFIDLGSGTGKAVLTAAAHTAFASATGVEILRPLHDAALIALKNCPPLKSKDVHFVCADALDYSWTECDLIFVSLTCFADEQVARIASGVDKLAKGARLLVTSRALESSGLRLLKRESLPYGKGRMTFLAYERI